MRLSVLWRSLLILVFLVSFTLADYNRFNNSVTYYSVDNYDHNIYDWTNDLGITNYGQFFYTAYENADQSVIVDGETYTNLK